MRLCRAILILAVLIIACLAAILAVNYPWPAFLVAVVATAASAKKGYRTLTSGGTARWANADDLERAGMLSGESGLPLGHILALRPGFFKAFKTLFNRSVPALLACEMFVRSMRKLQPPTGVEEVHLSNYVHLAVFAPTGVGKGVSCVIPFLLKHSGSVVVIDPKGENYNLTAARRREMGHHVVRVDPFGVCGSGADTFNPLDMIDPESPFVIDDCRALANALVIRSGQEKDPHWCDSAELWITAILVTVVLYAKKEERSLQTVRSILTQQQALTNLSHSLCAKPDCEGMVARLGSQLLNYKDKELAGVMTTTNRFLNFLDTIPVAASTRSSSFDPAELAKRKMTIYFVLPTEHLRTQSALMRMWIGSTMKAVVKNGLQERDTVTFVLDEAASLGRMEVLDDALDKYRGYGVRCQFYYQSQGQLSKCWGTEGGDQTFLSNVSAVYFGTQDPATAEHISTRLGEETIIVKSGGSNDGGSRQHSSQDANTSLTASWGNNSNWGEQARRLLTLAEVLALHPRTAITFTPGVLPIATRLTRYYEQGNAGKSRWKLLKWLAEVWLAALGLLFLAVIAAVVMTQIPQTR